MRDTGKSRRYMHRDTFINRVLKMGITRFISHPSLKMRGFVWLTCVSSLHSFELTEIPI
jgi:hypothetical protein